MKLTKTGIFKKLSLEPQKQWILQPDPGTSVRREISKALKISDSAARILASRLGPKPTAERARAFLQPNLADLADPWRLQQMDRAVDRLMAAIEKKETLCVYGDYDVDGVSSCALLLRVFQTLGISAQWYLPHRVEEGYGISEAFLHFAKEKGIGVVVTVDCGVSNFVEIQSLQESGIDVVITDHHEPGEKMPAAWATINPKRAGSEYPFRDLAGVGVAFKLAWALCERVSGSARVRPELREVLLDGLAYVALGTIADVMPLVGENRIYTTYGLRRLARTQHPGLRALLDSADLNAKRLEPFHVSFMLGPRINAAGRMQDARLALELLIADDPHVAAQRASQLDRQNKERQDLCRQIYEQAKKYVESEIDLEKMIGVVVVGEGWHEGVIGIVASKLAEEYKRPSVVITMIDGVRCKGSARSIPGLHLFEAMSRSRQRFESFGGHEMAAGFSLMRDQIEPFRQEFNSECRKQVMERGLGPELVIDMDVSLRQLSEPFAKEIQLLAPFGEGNPEPLFLARHVKVAGEPKFFGNNQQHFSFFPSQDQMSHRAVVFNHLDKTDRQGWLDRMRGGTSYWDIVFSVHLNDYYAPPRLEMHVADMRPS